MTEETISLGGKTWTIPPLPFIVCKKMQPALIRLSKKAVAAARENNIEAFDEQDVDALARWVWEAIQNAEEGEKLSMEEFEHLRFSIQDLLVAYPAVARACGLKWGPARPNGAGQSDADPLSTGTG